MNNIITMDLVINVIVIVGAVGGLWWKIQGGIQQNSKELSDFKLQVAKEYTSKGAMKDIERRLIHSIEKLSSHIDKLVESLIAKR